MNNRDRLKKSLIYLAGFMGSGKSTIGPILANTLGFEFVDVDRSVERRAQKRVVDIFASGGEQAFRVIERAALEEVAQRDHCVVSLGGGTIASEENFQLIRQSGIIVYLQLPPEEILQRVHHRTDRPLLIDEGGGKLPKEAMERRIQELLSRREEFYARADVVIRTEKKRVGTTVDEIVRRLKGLVDA
jgi:shikimate kinase